MVEEKYINIFDCRSCFGKSKDQLHNFVNSSLIFVYHVRRVSSRFEYFLQIFTPESVLVLKVIVLDAELNSASNGDIFKGSHRANRGLSQNTGLFTLFF
jgi:hypothetical protein